MMVKLTRTVAQTIDAVQYDGTNIKEVYDFICAHDGNANDVSFENLSKRPSHIPLKTSSHTLYIELFDKWKEKYKDEIDNYNKQSGFIKDSDLFSAEAFSERKYVDSFLGDWRADEEYHFYLSTNNDNMCRLIGICKGDWFTYLPDEDTVSHVSDREFKCFIETDGFEIVENKNNH